MEQRPTLVILVNTSRHFPAVEKLAEAAVRSGRTVCIHLMGAGLRFTDRRAFAGLARTARVSLCAASLTAAAGDPPRPLPAGVEVAPPSHLADLLDRGDRQLVF